MSPTQSPTPVSDRGLAGFDSKAAQNVASPSSVPCIPRSAFVPLEPQVAVLTAGRDRPYALGLAAALAAAGACFDFIGSNEVDGPELHTSPQIRFFNLRGEQSVNAGLLRKVVRVLLYYWRLLIYAATAKPKVFHVLWNNKFELFDRTLLMLYYKLLGKKLVFTAHNVNAAIRDGNDSFLNRFSLKSQYRLSDHIFVHTEKMKTELVSGFGVSPGNVTVIPFGINNTVPNSALSHGDARRQLGLAADAKALLFFGNIAPYKGLEYLVAAFIELAGKSRDYQLVIAGRPKGCDDYWDHIRQMIESSGMSNRVIQRIEYVPDEQTELYFKAADVLVLPYVHIFQSGVLFLGYSFGLPVIAADVGSLKDEIIEGETGFIFKPQVASDLAKTIAKYFGSDLYRDLESRRQKIREYANDRYSWAKVGGITRQVYFDLLAK